MKAIVLLFTKAGAGDSEDFPFAGLTRVNVTVEGNPNDLYSEGLAKRDMYEKVLRVLFALGIRVVPQKILHGQVRLRRGLQHG